MEQAEALARLPFVHPHVALMPDAHVGKGSSVGTVIPTRGAVIPAAVGVDIGCGMIAVETRYTKADLDRNAETYTVQARGYEQPVRMGKACTLADLREAIEAAIPLSPGNYNADTTRFAHTAGRIAQLDRLARNLGVDLSHSPKWREQLGSLGGGNHFIELCLDERDHVWLFLHSGSRGVGNKIAQHFIRAAQEQCAAAGVQLEHKDHAFLVENTPKFDAYLRALNWAQLFAAYNRDEMMDRYVTVFAEWLGVDRFDVEVERINAHHNYTESTFLVGDDSQHTYLTRKGAIDARAGKLGLIPGSMGTKSYIVRGKGNKASLNSAPHGAGRVFSRAEAKRRFTEADLADRMKGIEYRHGEAWIDEIPDAYKDIDVVIADSAPLVEVLHELRQLMNVKGT
ncbi:RtcB family protein [Prescottella equi]|uniref:RtcB family protein n=1 Tax=Rhodococcus hoagii TaxID=43767 RepID=UPI000D1140C6|nr:RtcB family protein [Prescottella equi]AVP71367.1 RNA-splicing ligase RtcB [Prescottella equi]